MTDKQINAAIAQACEIVSEDKYGKLYHTPFGYCRDCPNYCNDLNAMHEAEMQLSAHERDQMRMRLNMTLGNEYCCATGRQRAEAFLRTLGK